MNVLSGLGVPGLDRSSTTSFYGGYSNRRGFSQHWASRYSLWSYTDLYMSRGVAAKVVDRPADDSLARGLKIEGDEDNVMADEFDRLQVISKLQDAMRWSRLYGASVILVVAKDGGTFEDPLNLTTLDQIIELQVFDCNQIRPTNELYLDPLDPSYNRPEYYEIHPPGGLSFRVHETRLVPVGGDPIPPSFAGRGTIWWMGRSVLEGSIGDLARYEQGLEWSLRLLERKQQGIYSMEGLGDLFAEGQDDIVSRRINLVDLVRGNLNSVVVDKNDAYTVENLGLDGVQTVLQEFQTAVSAATDIPVVVLFGKSSTGLNATGAGDLENYYSLLTRIQTRILKPALERIVSYLWAQRTLGVTAPESWRVVFNPLWVATDQEKAQAELTEAQGEASEINALIALLNASILLPEEVREVVVTEYYDDFNFQANMPEKLQELADFSHEMATTPPPDPTQPPPPGGSGGP